MRTIKLRGQTTSGKKWVTGHLVFWAGNYQIWETEQDGETHNYQVIPESVGQFTGLKDKNGKEIYEGDIMELDNGYEKRRYEIKYEEGSFKFSKNGIKNGLFPIEHNNAIIVGNLHNNPELLS